MSLDQEIRKIKKSFPEVKFVRVSGNYVPDTHLLQPEFKRFAEIDKKTISLKWKNKNKIFGFAQILIAESLSSQSYKAIREAIIAHELVHLFCEQHNEYQVDNEVKKRGYGQGLTESLLLK